MGRIEVDEKRQVLREKSKDKELVQGLYGLARGDVFFLYVIKLCFYSFLIKLYFFCF